MNLFKRDKSNNSSGDQSALAVMALNAIHDGVIMTDKSGTIQFINPAAITMTECGSANNAIGLDYALVVKIESKEGRELSETENPLIQSMSTGQSLESYEAAIIAKESAKRIPVAISVLIVEGVGGNRIITFRNITKELEEEGEQTEFISTASHEMRTPVATIDGYLSLALNPQTATLDERARGYLTAAERASKHLGKLFQDLLDVTKLDDGKIRPHFEPVEMVSTVEKLSEDYIVRARDAKLTFKFGSDSPLSFGENHRIGQVAYGFVDLNFLREIVGNLIDNAIKYTPEGGSIYVNVRGDGDRVLINVTDTGIGISSDDLGHVFQKFYRADNSDTREIGGTGLGLYLVKQRAEAMGGKVWAESAFGEGSTFYVSLPRISSDEYEKRMIMVKNQQMMQKTPAPAAPTMPATQAAPQQTIAQLAQQTPPAIAQPNTPNPVAPQPTPQPIIQPSSPPAPQVLRPQPPPVAASPPIVRPTPTIQPVQNQTNNNLNGEIK
ncbi:PAS domain-containing protein [Candidatus Saccharibacteria bacterium]|nr:PAS domain-containing protein [Candidatus Saccharibacteria bacterium]